MRTTKIVIAGGGMVAGYAAKQMVELGLKSGDLTILSADTALPYERPPLSKGFMAGKETEDSIKINSQAFYDQHGIEVRLQSRISSLNAANKRLALASGEELGFEKLIVATGAKPRKLEIPGSDLGNVYYLRSIDDSKAIRKGVEGVKHAVVIGSGFIGMEVASVLAQRGIQVTMILAEDRLSARLFTPQMSRFFENYYEARGVRFIKNARVAGLQGEGTVTGAALKDGQTVLGEMIVAGIGVTPATDMLTGSGPELNNGVVVNEFLETNQPGILAAGDLANYPDLLFGKRRRVEHWDNAVSQGQHCGHILMGDRTAFKHVPYFFSDIFDLSYEYWGDSAETDEVVARGDPASSSFSVWWLKGKSVRAAFTMNRDEEERTAAPKWIESKQQVLPDLLSDSSKPFSAAIAGR